MMTSDGSRIRSNNMRNEKTVWRNNLHERHCSTQCEIIKYYEKSAASNAETFLSKSERSKKVAQDMGGNLVDGRIVNISVRHFEFEWEMVMKNIVSLILQHFAMFF